MSNLPILYSFRRCPYAMRARMALFVSGTICELREVKLADKPPELAAISNKATVPTMLLPDGTVLDESLAIMRWALAQSDPEGWLDRDDPEMIALIDGPFKHHLDRFKYPSRYGDCNPMPHREAAMKIVAQLNARLNAHANLSGPERGLTDIAIFPFIRQFANTDRDWFDAQPLSDLHAWLERHLASTLFAAIMPKYKPWRSGDAVKRFPQ